jgi:hypothetical protein
MRAIALDYPHTKCYTTPNTCQDFASITSLPSAHDQSGACRRRA